MRTQARLQKDWTLADTLRQKLTEIGVTLFDKTNSWRSKDGLTGRIPAFSELDAGQPIESIIQEQLTPLANGLSAGGAAVVDDSQIRLLVQQREQARAQKDFARSDEVRDELKALGVEVFDKEKMWRAKNGLSGCIIGFHSESGATDLEITTLVVQREKARQSSDFGTADMVRMELRAAGVEIYDKEKVWKVADGRQGPVPSWTQIQAGGDNVLAQMQAQQQQQALLLPDMAMAMGVIQVQGDDAMQAQVAAQQTQDFADQQVVAQPVQVDDQALQMDSQTIQLDGQAFNFDGQTLQLDGQTLHLDDQTLQLLQQAQQAQQDQEAEQAQQLQHAQELQQAQQAQQAQQLQLIQQSQAAHALQQQQKANEAAAIGTAMGQALQSMTFNADLQREQQLQQAQLQQQLLQQQQQQQQLQQLQLQQQLQSLTAAASPEIQSELQLQQLQTLTTATTTTTEGTTVTPELQKAMQIMQDCAATGRIPQDSEIDWLVGIREKLRQARDFATADEIRNALRNNLGVELYEKEKRWATADGRQGFIPLWKDISGQ